MASFKRKTKGEITFSISSYVIMTIVALGIFLPLLYIVQITFSADVSTAFRIFPKKITLMNYKYVFEKGMISIQFLNSLKVTFLGTGFSIICLTFISYPLSRKGMPFRRIFNFLILVPMLFSIGFLPKFLLIRELNWINTYWAIIVPYGIGSFNLIILRNFFQSIPDSLIESAKIDGASELRILWQIVIPLSKAALATVTLFCIVYYWNEYFNVILYINIPKKYTLQVVLRQVVMEDESVSSNADAILSRNIQYTTIVVALLPVMIVYPILQKYFTKGIMLGSVKG